MPRKARLDVPGTLHHVMVRGIDGINIFRDEEDRKAFVGRVRSLAKETGTRILAWVLGNGGRSGKFALYIFAMR